MKNIFIALLMTTLMSSGVAAEPAKASWYQEGKVTANGEKFNPDGFTVAHKTLPFGTKLLLTYKGKSVVVRVNDRGPFVKGRQLDLSRGTAKFLGCTGVCVIDMQVIES